MTLPMFNTYSRPRASLISIGMFAALALAERAVAESTVVASGADSAQIVGTGSTALISARRSLADEDLVRGFASPPVEAKPMTWWHWMDGNITPKGITADLEAMKQIGLGGAQIIDLSYQIPRGPVRFLTPEWLEATRFAAREAQRLGLNLGMGNASGWSSTGGPWITPDLAMQHVVWSEARVSGFGHFDDVLPKPEVGEYGKYYHDIAVLAIATPLAEKITLRTANPKITPANLVLPTPSNAEPQTALFEFAQPFAARSLFFDYVAGMGMVEMAVQVSDDGVKFKTVATTRFRQHAQLGVAFPETAARYYRLLLTGTPRDGDRTPVTFSNLELLDGYRLPDWPAKAGAASLVRLESDDQAEVAPAGTTYRREGLIDLSDMVDTTGKLNWAAPAGDWTILRFGYAPSGKGSAHPNPEGSGLEVDKLSQGGLDLHFKSMIDPILKEMGSLAGKTFSSLLIDSYEVGAQNWTTKFREEFRERRGYDLVTYLPALTGRVMDSTETTERFLWDVRRTVAELFAQNYYTHFKELCHARGLVADFETYGGPFPIMDCSAIADLPMSEFWTGASYRRPNARTHLVVSGAHLGGKQVVGAEAFTSGFENDRFSQDPYSLKALGDFQFCEGINQFIFHRYAMQPWSDRAPGMTMGPWGLHFERTNTWWKQGRAWIEYLTRSQFLLQAGMQVADVLCFAGEDDQAQARWGMADLPSLPVGHDFEFANASALLAASVADHFIVLPDGAKFQVLVLPDTRRVTPAVATKIAALVQAGARVIGPPPNHSPSLSDFPACDETVRRTATALWGDCDGRNVTEHASGLGSVFWGQSAADVLQRYSIRPDFAFTSGDRSAQICFKHRVLPAADIYFVSNQREQAESFEASFRMSGSVPTYWHADTGIIEPVALYREQDGVVSIPMQLEPAGSVFVVFRKAAAADGHAVSFTQQALPTSSVEPLGQLSYERGALMLNAWNPGDYSVERGNGPATQLRVAAIPTPIRLQGAWEVRFPPRLGAPEAVTIGQLASLSKQGDPGVRYFSGTATYRKEFDLSADQFAPRRELFLDLGVVKNIAEVMLNGSDLGILWKPPFRVRVTSAVHPGKNWVEVRVTNLWANRLIGDEQLPDDCEWIAVPSRGLQLKKWPSWFVEHQPRPTDRVTFATWKFYSKNDPLPDSGLIGPVTIAFVERVKIESNSPKQ